MGEELRSETEEPRVSELPLAPIVAQTPLVIDLPDGQKLVISNLDPGTVIEVATWRGTGRPDSRTNRLMLGVSASEEEVPTSEKSQTKRFSRAQGATAQLRSVSSEMRSSEFQTSTPEPQPVPVDKSDDRMPEQKKTFGNWINLRGLVKFSAMALALTLIFVGLIGPGKFRVVHPQSGVSSSLGSAVNSFVILRQGSGAKVGEAVIAEISDPKSSPVLAVVNAVDNDNYLLATNTEQFQSNSKKIHGKVLIVIPYLGIFATLLNK